MKLPQTVLFHSFARSKICLRVEMRSLQDLSLRKPAFSLRISFYRLAVKSFSMNLLSTLPVRLKIVLLLQLFQSDRFPSFATHRIRPVFKHVLGYPDFCRKSSKGWWMSEIFLPVGDQHWCRLPVTILHLADGVTDFSTWRRISVFGHVLLLHGLVLFFSSSGRLKILCKWSWNHPSCRLRRIKLCLLIFLTPMHPFAIAFGYGIQHLYVLLCRSLFCFISRVFYLVLLATWKLSPTQDKTLPLSFFTGLFPLMYALVFDYLWACIRCL